MTLLSHRLPVGGGRRGRLVRCALGAALLVSCVTASSALAVDVFPIPGAHVAAPGTQITFRGVAASQLTGITVIGSRSRSHGGSIRADSDGFGGSFVPGRAFRAGETVTVHTHFNITGARNGTFSFQVANPASRLPTRPGTSPKRTPGDVYTFHTTSLRPAAVHMDRTGGDGDIFLGPQEGPLTAGAEILDRNGHLVWYHPAPAGNSVTDFRVQSYRGQPVLTWWQGHVNTGTGSGTDYIYDSSYRQIATVRAANGLGADLHEFEVTSANTALITAYYPVYVNGRSIHRPARQIVLDSVVQEIDIPTGLVLFQWDSLDHVPLTDSRASLPPRNTRQPFDYFHVNAIDVDPDGNLVISARNTWAAYKLSRQTGHVIWTLGGRHSTFKLGPSDVRVPARCPNRSAGDATVTLFDDGGGPPKVHPSRALELALDLTAPHCPCHLAMSALPVARGVLRGQQRLLLNLDDFVGWGGMPYFTEYDRKRQGRPRRSFRRRQLKLPGVPVRLDGHPAHRPAIAATRRGNRMLVYGKLEWGHQRVELACARRRQRKRAPAAGRFSQSRLETAIDTAAQRAVAVAALDRAGHVLGRSAVTAPR